MKKKTQKQILSEEYENNNEKIILKYISNELKLRETLRELDKNLGIYLVKSSSINQTLPSKQ